MGRRTGMGDERNQNVRSVFVTCFGHVSPYSQGRNYPKAFLMAERRKSSSNKRVKSNEESSEAQASALDTKSSNGVLI